MNKTCGECRFLIPEYDRHGRGRCYYTDNRYLPSCGACKAFAEKYGGNQPTNGDKIRAMSNDELAELFDNSCKVCAKDIVECDTDCVAGILAWLNAPAESEGEDVQHS